MSDIIVVGFPKSGNTWMARLVGEILNSPVVGLLNFSRPIAMEGEGRPGIHAVYQLHTKPVHNESSPPLINQFKFNVDSWADEKVIHIIRDPRDIVVSAHFYWDRQDMSESIDMVERGTYPIGHDRWAHYVRAWGSVNSSNLYHIRYEDLLSDTHSQLIDIVNFLGFGTAFDIDEIIKRQSIYEKRKQIEKDGDSRQWGKNVQLKCLRKGISGDWKNHFTYKMRAIACGYWQPELELFEYESSTDWVRRGY